MTTPCSFRPDNELLSRIERRAALEGMTKAQFIETAVRHYLGQPPRFPHRRQFEAVLRVLFLCKSYCHSIATQILGKDTLEEDLPNLERETLLAVRALLDRLDTLDGA